MNLGLTFRKTDCPQLHGYVDADWANDPADRKSFTGYCFLYGSCCISWECKKQTTVALSSTEAEYIALGEAAKEAVHMSSLLKELQHPQQIIRISSDNQSAQKIASNSAFHRRTKHIDVRHHYIRQLVEDKMISLAYVPTQQMPHKNIGESEGEVVFQWCSEFIGLC